MKKALRRALSALCALALTVSCVSFSAFAADNLADGATVFVDSIHGSWAAEPSKIVDGSYNTRWQAAHEVSADTPTFFGIAWTQPKTFDTVKVYWETSAAASGNSKLYVAYAAASLTAIEQTRFQETCYTDDGTVWTEVQATPARTPDPAVGNTDVKHLDTWSLEAPLEDVYAIKIVATAAADDSNKNLSPFELEVFDLSAGTPYDVNGLKAAKTYVDKAFGTENVYGYSSTSWTAYTTAYAKVASAITACDNKMIGEVSDYLTQEALDALAAPLYEAAAKLTGNGTLSENLLANGIMIYNKDDMQSYAGDNNFRTLTDGKIENKNTKNCWQPKTAQGSYLYLKLNNAADVEKLAVYAESTAEAYSIQVTTADVTAITTVADMDKLQWSEATAIRDYAVDLGNSTAYQSYYFEEVQKGVTAVKLTCTTPNGRYCKLFEVEAYGAGEANSSFDAAKLYATDDGATKFFVTNLAKEDVPENKILKLSFELTNTDGKIAKAQVNVDAAYSLIVLGGDNICAGTLENANAGDYMVGVSFINAADVASITLVNAEFIAG